MNIYNIALRTNFNSCIMAKVAAESESEIESTVEEYLSEIDLCRGKASLGLERLKIRDTKRKTDKKEGVIDIRYGYCEKGM
jgi:hypothetical protein